MTGPTVSVEQLANEVRQWLQSEHVHNPHCSIERQRPCDCDVLRHAPARAALSALQARVEAAERERDEARKAIYDRDEYGRKTGCDCHEHSTGDPDYTPAYQDEYQRLWHEAAARAQRLESALEDTNELLVRVAKWIQEPDIPPTEMSRYVASRWASARAAMADTPKEGTP